MLMGGGPPGGGMGAGGMGSGAALGMPQTSDAGIGGLDLPTADELADVQFTPSFYTRYPSDARSQGQGQRGW